MNGIIKCSDDMAKVANSLRGTWDLARDGWKDTDRERFEQEIMNELNQSTSSYINSIRKLGESLQNILNELP